MYERKPHGNKGRKHTDETRAKISKSQRNNANASVPDDLRIHPQRIKEPRPHAAKGKPKSIEHRQKIAQALRHNTNASALNRVLKMQTTHQIKPIIAPSKERAARQPRAHSEETRAKIRAAMTGNHNAIRERTYINQPTHNKLVPEPANNIDSNDDLHDLETELMAMLNKDKTLPLHPAPPKPQDIQETPEEREIRQRKNAVDVLGKDFFDGWEDTPTAPDDLKTLEQELIAMAKEQRKHPIYTKPLPALDNMRDFFATDAEFQEWKAAQND